ncbi:SPOR domain-containing protein [Paramagnetospirillum marisnigri]|nr:SPOR domain-containing protein [Paramagnetospirillum marisnigri]
MALIAALALLGACAERKDGMQTVRDGLFYDGLAAFHEGFYPEAANRWERAARFGDAEAARNLGHLYRQGLGVEQDAAKARDLYQVAADAGVISAQYNLGMLYLKGGNTLPPDRTLGLHWLGKAAAAGLPPAKVELERQTAEPAPAPAPVAAEPAVPKDVAVPVEVVPPFIDPPAVAKVQIGSYRVLADAEKDWLRLRPKGLEREIISVRMGERGTWHRLLAVGSPEAVEAYCQEAARHKIGCWPGKRN